MQNDEAEITVHSPGHKGSHDAFVRQTPFRRCWTERSRKSLVGQARGGCVVDQIVEKVPTWQTTALHMSAIGGKACTTQIPIAESVLITVQIFFQVSRGSRRRGWNGILSSWQ